MLLGLKVGTQVAAEGVEVGRVLIVDPDQKPRKDSRVVAKDSDRTICCGYGQAEDCPILGVVVGVYDTVS